MSKSTKKLMKKYEKYTELVNTFPVSVYKMQKTNGYV